MSAPGAGPERPGLAARALARLAARAPARLAVRPRPAFKAIMPADGPPCPDGGDAAFDQNLQVVVQMIGALHLQAADVIEDDSAKLARAHARYARTEESLTRLCQQIIAPDKIN